MQERQEEYQANIQNNTAAFQEVKKKITQIVVLRIFVFAVTCFGCYLFSYNAGLAISTGVFGALFFVFMVQYHSKLDRKKNYFEELISINEIEIEALNGNIDNLENGAEFLSQIITTVMILTYLEMVLSFSFSTEQKHSVVEKNWRLL